MGNIQGRAISGLNGFKQGERSLYGLSSATATAWSRATSMIR